MGRALSLAAYRALSWRTATPTQSAPLPVRPEGELLWVHIGDHARVAPLGDLCRRLLVQRPGLHILFTHPVDVDVSNWSNLCSSFVPLPADHPSATRSFLDHWKPDMCLWSGGDLQPNLLSQASASRVPLVLVDAREEDITPRRLRWLPDLTRTTLDCFDMLMAVDESVARIIRRAGIGSGKVQVSAPLRVSPSPTPWPEDELVDTNHALAGRPVWLSAWTQDKEFISVLTAHRNALRMLHRLLLVLHVADPAESGPLQARLAAMDLRCADWDAGDEIEDTTQVILSAEAEDLGLWFRVAPLTFMGSSLEPGGRGRDPLIAAALGSALLYGPNVRNHIDTYSRLAASGAGRSVRDAEALGAGVVQLLAPDHAATMALAGWQLVTEGAHQIDQVIELVQDRLDEREVNHAAP